MEVLDTGALVRGIGWGSGGRDRVKKKMSCGLSPVNLETAEPIFMKLGGKVRLGVQMVYKKKNQNFKNFLKTFFENPKFLDFLRRKSQNISETDRFGHFLMK